jgi:hypothetical protein
MSEVVVVSIFLALTIGGFLLETLLAQFHHFIFKAKYKRYHYSFSRYLFFLLFPLTALLFVLADQGFKILTIFIFFSVIGPILEALAGYSYHMVVGQRLWTYHRHSLKGYTSVLSAFLWGLGGVLFWLLVEIFKNYS